MNQDNFGHFDLLESLDSNQETTVRLNILEEQFGKLLPSRFFIFLFFLNTMCLMICLSLAAWLCIASMSVPGMLLLVGIGWVSPGASNKATDGRLKRGHFV